MKKIITYLLVIGMSFVVLTSCKKNEEKKEYNVILTPATIPPMISLLDIVDQDLTNNETYVWIGRQNTISDVTKLKNAFKK